jgi:hypothetical protein
MYIDIFQYLEDMKARLGKDSKTYAALVQAFNDHADLRAYLDGSVSICAAGVNPFVDQMDIDRGQDIYVYPFVKDKGAVIHSDPPFFYIGSRNSTGFGVHPAQGWEDEMALNSVNDALVKKVKSFLLANVPYDLPDEPVKT